MPVLSNNSFAKQWGLLGLVFLLLAGAVIHNLYNGYHDTKAIEQQRLGTQTRIVADSIADEITITDRVLQRLCSDLCNSPAERWGSTIDSNRLKQLEGIIPGIRTFLGIDKNGIARFSNRKELIGTNLGYREYFKKAQSAAEADALFIAPPFQTILGVWGMPLVRTVTGPDGSFNGIVVATLDPAYFTNLLGTVNYSKDMLTTIIHGDGLLFTMAPERKELFGKNLGLPGTLFNRHITSNKPENIYNDLFYVTGDRRMVALKTVSIKGVNSDTPIVIAAARKQSDIFAGWKAHLRNQLLILATICLASAFALVRYQQYKRIQLRHAATANDKLRKLTHGIENSASAVLITDVQGSIEYVNKKFTQLTGYTFEEAFGQNPRILKSDFTPREVFEDLWKTILNGKEWRGELLNRRKNGDVYWSVASISPLHDEQGVITHFIANVEDINERKNAEATIERLAYFDPLTDLPNRRMLQDRLELALKRSKRQSTGAALIYLDLDSFKDINDSLGHPAGDSLLRELAHRFSSTLRDDDVVCRLGGDEFAIILHDIRHDEDAIPVAQKLLDVISEPLVLEGRELAVTGSVGIALYPQDGNDGKTLEKHADIALYHAKEEGKNTFRFFSEDLNKSFRDRIAMEHGLRHALDRAELELHYQPKVCIATGKVSGVEALLRWSSPEFGTVSPMRFIPLAEETRQIIPIGEWVLRNACRQQLLWKQQGLDLNMAVNLSAVQFKSPNLVERIAAIIDETGIQPEKLELELTESALVDKPDVAVQVLEELRSLGCGISIDDFGTGYSSLSYLKSFPVTILKIDRSFVRDLAHDSGDRAIAQSVVSLATNLDMQTVAEGVEDAEQLEILQQIGCTYIQGFIYSRPVAAAELPSVICRING